MQANLGRLENLIGHKFGDITLLERALTHRSWAYENGNGVEDGASPSSDNESLEFIGDSVVGLIVAEQLFLRHPTASEGDLTLMKHHLVSGSALAKVAEGLGLGDFLKLGGSEQKAGRKKRSLLTNTFEAVVGAVFLDSGYVATRVVVTRMMESKLKSVTPADAVDFKSKLQTELQALKQKTAEYTLLRTEGPPHDRTFFVEVVWENGNAHGEGNSIKAAEMKAAEAALAQLGKPGKGRSKRIAKD